MVKRRASEKRKIATNVPTDILDEAVRLSGLNQTAAIVEGLKELINREKRRKLLGLEGKLKLSYDVTRSRERGPIP